MSITGTTFWVRNQKQPEETPYLTFISDNGEFQITTANLTKNWDGTIEYSTDATSWSIWNGYNYISSNNEKLYVRGSGNTVITGSNTSTWQIGPMEETANIRCLGNIEMLLDWEMAMNGNHPNLGINCFRAMFLDSMALIESPRLESPILSENCYLGMFWGCENLIEAPELPATTLANGCYSNMFQNCTNLTTPPELPATVLADECYKNMFYSCSSLSTSPSLPAITLAPNCYANMFFNCYELASAPQLPAMVLADNCYESMFRNCSSLTTPPELPATTLAAECYYLMFLGCTSLSTLPKLTATSITSKAYSYMFSGCSNLKLSSVETSEYPYTYRIPITGTGQSLQDSLDNMFNNTGGTFTGTPTINTTYYTDHQPV